MGGKRGSSPLCSLPRGQEGLQAHANFQLSYLVIGHFPTLYAVWLKECFLGASLPTPTILWYNYENNVLNIVILEENLGTKIYPCGGTCLYIDVPSVETLPLVHEGTPVFSTIPLQHEHPYISAQVNNGSVAYDHDSDGTHSQVSGCTVSLIF